MRHVLSRREVLTAALGLAVTGPLSSEGQDAPASGRLHYEVTRPTLTVPGLDPAHEGLSVAQLSDVHIGEESPLARLQSAVQAVNAARPDVLLLTGDYVTFHAEPLAQLHALLSALSVPAFAVLGNHDHDVDAARVRRVLERAGVTVLQNAHTRTRLRGAPLTLLGVDDGQTHHADVGATFKGAPARGTRLVLAHTPPTARGLPPDAGLVCFSGHTHGGSVMVPGVTHLISTLWGQPYVRGLYQVNGNQLYVNRGIGFGNGKYYAPRLNSAPELTFHTLRSGPQTSGADTAAPPQLASGSHESGEAAHHPLHRGHRLHLRAGGLPGT